MIHDDHNERVQGGVIMTRAIQFTQAQVRRAVKGVESAGLRVKRVTVNPDGSITLDSDGADPVIDNREKAPAVSWEDA